MPRCTVLWFPLLFVGTLHGQSAPARSQSGAAPDFAAIDAYVTREMRGERIPGVSIAIVHGGEVVHARGFGADGAGHAITPQTPFLLGSMSKSFTALALMQLVQAGRVNLDSPAQSYLPEFRVADSVASASITLRHLLYHTSGIPTGASRGPAGGGLLGQVAALSQVTLESTPGTVHEYASPNYIVLGAIVERVAGISFAEYVRTQLLTPLDMQHSHVSQEEAMRDGMSRGHRYWFGFPVATTLPYEADRLPTASIIASAEDLGHFMIAQLDAGRYLGTQLLSPDAVVEMHRGGVVVEGFSYAMGWRVSRDAAGQTRIHHGGIVPHFRGKMVMLPESGWGVVVLTNVSSSLPMSPASHRVADNVASYLAGTPLPEAGSRFKLVHFAIALLVALISAHQVRQTLAVVRGRTNVPTGPGSLARAAARVLVPIAVVICVPLLLGISWGMAWQSMPDIVLWVVALALVDLGTRLYTVVQVRRGTSA
ncbi:MAG: serine hydrolase domain-containing protein [Gemmatimonadales bacterium]|nr:serine hydrolase domain-containing protein [Gemmatimonadales bacterium]